MLGVAYVASTPLGFADVFWILLGYVSLILEHVWKGWFSCGCRDRCHRHGRRWRGIRGDVKAAQPMPTSRLGRLAGVCNVSLFRSHRSIVSHSFFSLSISFVPPNPLHRRHASDASVTIRGESISPASPRRRDGCCSTWKSNRFKDTDATRAIPHHRPPPSPSLSPRSGPAVHPGASALAPSPPSHRARRCIPRATRGLASAPRGRGGCALLRGYPYWRL